MISTRLFNGATSFQTWKCPAWRPNRLRRWSLFNGATSFQTWKCRRDTPASSATWALQWGHVFSDVEIPERHAPVISAPTLQWGHVFSDVEMTDSRFIWHPATTLQWGHVFSDVEIAIVLNMPSRPTISFNGATSFQTWKYQFFFSVGRRAKRLQWGHVFSDVEISHPA